MNMERVYACTKPTERTTFHTLWSHSTHFVLRITQRNYKITYEANKVWTYHKVKSISTATSVRISQQRKVLWFVWVLVFTGTIHVQPVHLVCIQNDLFLGIYGSWSHCWHSVVTRRHLCSLLLREAIPVLLFVGCLALRGTFVHDVGIVWAGGCLYLCRYFWLMCTYTPRFMVLVIKNMWSYITGLVPTCRLMVTDLKCSHYSPVQAVYMMLTDLKHYLHILVCNWLRKVL